MLYCLSQEILMAEDERRLELAKIVIERLGHEDENINRLSLEQLEFIVNDINCSSFLNSCPGSGKTEVVGFKSAFESSSWDSANSGIAILTFTRNAASEIWKRASNYSNQKAVQFPHFVGTIDSWLHQYIFQPFCYSVMGFEGKNGDTSVNIVDQSSKASFLDAFKTVTSRPPTYKDIKINHYSLTNNDSINFNRENNSTINSDIEQNLIINKQKFARSGFATYQDAEYWIYKLLNTNPQILEIVAKRFPYIIIDECQDLSPSRLELLELFRLKGVILHFVGDLHQSIYDFIDVNPNLIEDFTKKSEMTEMYLTKNFRSNQEIVNLCSKLIGNETNIEGNTNPDDTNTCILWKYQPDSLNTLPALFERYLESKSINCNNCSILVRGNKLINQLQSRNTLQDSISTNIAKAFFLHVSNTNDLKSKIESLNLMGKSLCSLAYNGKGNHQNHYCPVTFEHIAWRMLLIDIINSSQNIATFKHEDNNQTWSQWCASLKEYLKPYFEKLPETCSEWEEAKRKIRAPNNKGSELVTESFTTSTSTSNVRITTIHDIKGETLDVAMLVSSPTRHSKGGHFEDWLEDTSSEYARFAYVACSRPRQLLIVAVPSLSEEQKVRLESIGLVSKEMPGTLSYWLQ